MNTDELNNNPTPDPDGNNPLEFWVAYMPGEGEKKNYLSDGKGNLRVFKSERVLREWLKPQLSPEVYEMVIVHSVQGNITLPEDGTFGAPPNLILPQDSRKPAPLDLSKLNITPIQTLALPTIPSAQEQLDYFAQHRRRRRRRN